MSDLRERARNRLIRLPGHFAHAVRVETAEEIGPDVYLLKVRDSSGHPDETQVTAAELESALADQGRSGGPCDPRDLFRWVEGHRIRLSFAHDPLFAVSMSGVRGLPHQIEAVYRHMLPQPRLRFVLADDPGAGKTIMAGLLLKELKLRGVIDRCLILAPAPLTPQWQDEMLEKFDEQFEIVSGEQVRHQLGRSAWDRYPMVITSVDFAKRDDVRDDLLRAEWDLVVIDEAHKCSAYTGTDDSPVRTRRYILAEGLASRTERLLLMTATPHSGDEDRFTRFLALLDPDQFSSPDLVKRQITQDGNPYFLRRQKEDLVNERGTDLFVPRHVRTQPFQLSAAEKDLYDEVTRYVNTYLGSSAAGRGSAVALARTVLQRRLASSLGAIHSSLAKRAARLQERTDELDRMSPAERRRRLAELGKLPGSGSVADSELADDDVDEDTEDEAAASVTGAAEIEALRAEIAELRGLVIHASRVQQSGTERKLVALRACLTKAELRELQDGRGRLLIFTEHKDTLEYLERHLRDWGYTVCTIHGGHSPAERKRIQRDFRLSKQICIATEAAGEGINLQFCHLMVNYDLPWNPVRLEQRMGRVHRIGQEHDCYIFNFCATNTVEGQLVKRLHDKLETMRDALHGRVYDVIGDLLTLNGIDFERLVKDTLLNPHRINAAKDQISRMTAAKYQEYQEATGIALARRHVDMEWVREQDFTSEERRLMPEYAEAYFLDAAEQVRLRVERRADTLLRIEHVPVALRSDDLASVGRVGRPSSDYRKLTFRKEQRDRAEHGDAVLCSPGHPLFAAVIEALDRELEARGVPQSAAVFIDPAASAPYDIYLFSYEVVGEDQRGRPEPAFAEVAAVIEDQGEMRRAPADVLYMLTPADPAKASHTSLPDPEAIKDAENWLRVNIQMPRTGAERATRLEQAEVRSIYLQEAMTVQRRRLEDRWTEYDARVARGEDTYRLQRDTTLNRLRELEHRQKTKLEGFARLGVVRSGKVTHLGTARVLPAVDAEVPDHEIWRPSKEVEDAAMAAAMQFERDDGWTPVDVSEAHDGSGFDIRSVRRGPGGDVEVRRIEVKGRSAATGDVGLYRTEWYAAGRWGAGFWLYVVYAATTSQRRLVRIQNPYHALRNVSEISQITGYRVPAASIEELA